MIIDILIVAALFAAVLVAVIATRPSEFCVSRSAVMSAPAPILFEQVNNLLLWAAWSPWDKLDPDMKKTFAGPPAGVDASCSWVGEKSGEGSMTITESRPNQLVRLKLDFVKPFKASNTAEFTFQSQENQTVVTWSMSGKNNFMAKAFGLIMSCDKMVGGEFEKGLANLNSITQAEMATAR